MMLNAQDFRESARRYLPRFVFDYIDGAAEDEYCLKRNTSDMHHWQLTPSCLRDTKTIDHTINVFGKTWKAPLGIAPIGFSGLVRPRGDVLMARAAAAQGVPFILSTASNSRLEDVRAAAPDAQQWMQLYVMENRAIAEQLVRRAARAGYGALVLTVDVPISGFRERDVRNGFKLPFRPGLSTLIDLATHPRWSIQMGIHGSPSFVNLSEETDQASSPQVQAALLARAMDRTMVWESLAWLRGLWSGPLLIKGVLHPQDAKRALQFGVDGLIVSNHGGRQLDAAPSTISVLPSIIDAVAGRCPVFVDSGFRRGSDIVKALSMGASAAFVGRPPVWGLAANGETGVNAVLKTLIDEISRTLTLVGARSIGDLSTDHLLYAQKIGTFHV